MLPGVVLFFLHKTNLSELIVDDRFIVSDSGSCNVEEWRMLFAMSTRWYRGNYTATRKTVPYGRMFREVRPDSDNIGFSNTAAARCVVSISVSSKENDEIILTSLASLFLQCVIVHR